MCLKLAKIAIEVLITILELIENMEEDMKREGLLRKDQILIRADTTHTPLSMVETTATQELGKINIRHLETLEMKMFTQEITTLINQLEISKLANQ
jgi:hypothetical protein